MSVNCSIPCHRLIKFSSSCPTFEINFNNIDKKTVIELIMMFFSLTPYPLMFSICVLVLLKRTTRVAFIASLLMFEFVLVEVLKNIHKDPRPNFVCTKQYGFPSNHSCFFTSIAIWFTMEKLFLEKKFRYKNNIVLRLYFIVFPFIIYSRYHLNYHSLKQIISGCLLGIIVSILYFFICIKIIIKIKFISVIYKFFCFTNNISDDFVDEVKKSNKNKLE